MLGAGVIIPNLGSVAMSGNKAGPVFWELEMQWGYEPPGLPTCPPRLGVGPVLHLHGFPGSFTQGLQRRLFQGGWLPDHVPGMLVLKQGAVLTNS